MIDFFLSALAGAFIMLVFLQLATQKTINFAGYVEKSEDPKRFWTFTLTYFTGFI
ncbi:MAG TPA: hypothetical protein VFG39_04795 [Balneolaceae bacterium]|nr:hypothetical protein [Balneolaceae bacterium]